MKRCLLLAIVLLSLSARSQTFNNEWINYNNTYYKFKVGVTGLYRISQTALGSIGLGSTPAEQFQLWRNGQQIPIFTTVSTGAMTSSDYIEFWGEMNDGKPDNALYRLPDFQLSDKWSLQTDTAAFFLTVNTSGVNLRLTPTANNVSTSMLSPEPYFMHKTGTYYKNKNNPGYGTPVGSFVYASAYDQGEGWSSGDILNGSPLNDPMNNLNVYTGPGAPDASFNIHATGTTYNPRSVLVKVNGTTIMNQTMDFFDYIKMNIPVPLALISSGTASIEINNTSLGFQDRMVVAQDLLTYPRQFNFDNARNFSFELPANPAGNYLEISNFNYGGTAPVLYDLTNGARYVADISNPSLIKIALMPSLVARKMLLVSEAAINITAVSVFQQRNFVNLNLAANQGNYLIISHPVLTNGTGGTDPVDAYRAYRSSVPGGGYSAKVYMIDDLVDQFGFGIKKHPLSVRNFIYWARNHFTTVPIKDVLLLGKGVTYNQYRSNESQPTIDNLNLIPTFGNPASDNLLAAEPGPDEIPKVPIGRLSVITADEVAVYLAKVVQYEQAQKFASPLINDKAWMKTVVHVVGASDDNLTSILSAYMENYRKTIIDTFYGGNVSTFVKASAGEVEELGSVHLQKLFEDGIGLMTYFGHSSTTTLAFNIDNPLNYNNPGKYPVMIAMGCNAGNMYNFNQARFQTKETTSEKFVLADQRGSIAFIASSSLGIVYYLDQVNSQTYTAAATTAYGKTIGETLVESVVRVFTANSQNDFFARIHTEQTILHGDPAIRLNSFPKPDYVIESPMVKIAPSFLSIAETTFKVDASFMNIGKAVNRNIVVEVKRTYPDLTTQVIRRDTIPGIRFLDSLSYTFPIDPIRDKGLNRIIITVDADNVVDELYETNNSITKDFFIFEDEARTVYPYNFAIINKQNIKFYASTANAFAALKQFRMELDTTELFNSSFKVTRNLSSTGGLLEFNPGITFTDSTVYYWRVGIVPASGSPTWNTASFVYLPNSDPGFNQSHYFQHDKSGKERIILDGQNRNWKFDSLQHNIFIKNGVFQTATNQEGDLIVSIDNDPYIRSACVGYSLIFNLIEPLKIKPNLNLTGAYGSAGVCSSSRQWNYEWSYLDAPSRKLIMDFLDSIPVGYYVVVRNILNEQQVGGFISNWQADTSLYGSGNSLYHKLKNLGFDKVDQFTSAKAFAFMYKKNDNNFTPVSVISNGIYDLITLSQNIKSPDTLGYITSPVFGPAKSWKQLKWRGSTDILPGDIAKVDVIGIRNDNTETTLFSNLDFSQQDFDISSINASIYRNIKLRMRNQDSLLFTPYQLRYWRVTYVPAPEGALAPNIYLKMKDTLDAGEPLDFRIAFKNISDAAFDSLKFNLKVTDKNNVDHVIFSPRRRPLTVNGTANDTLQVGGIIDTRNLSGFNTMFLDVNPENDQPEQYHFNNFAYRNFYIRPDSLNPLLDVTFDGVHILNRDIVSSRPDIVIKLKDESKWLVLNDTSLAKVQVHYPNTPVTSRRTFYFNTDTLHFTPAGQAPAADNTAMINFRPYFTVDGEYDLYVTGKDMSNNSAGSIEYRVTFQVINKPMISNMLNYPNPFTTSTAFVFTVTGNEVPQNIKIEIMTITGKIVREITKDELGPLHIGRNITEFKWDGTDQFGQKLANGIYLYRVITNLNGKVLEKYNTDENNTEKYFNKGYGKMYLMR